jgi:nicotinamidase-related amidase
MSIPRFRLGQSALVVVDMQERLVPAMREPQALIESIARLLDGAAAMELPVLATEQYRKGLGPTIEPIAQRLSALAAPIHEKLKFSACIEPVRSYLAEQRIHAAIVCGIEAHVCVMQTCLDLIEAGYVTAFVTDAIRSRRAHDQAAAEARLLAAGAVPVTVESVLFELLHEAGTERFRKVLEIVK